MLRIKIRFYLHVFRLLEYLNPGVKHFDYDFLLRGRLMNQISRKATIRGVRAIIRRMEGLYLGGYERS